MNDNEALEKVLDEIRSYLTPAKYQYIEDVYAAIFSLAGTALLKLDCPRSYVEQSFKNILDGADKPHSVQDVSVERMGEITAACHKILTRQFDQAGLYKLEEYLDTLTDVTDDFKEHLKETFITISKLQTVEDSQKQPDSN
jgi:hypothetical protein